MTSYVAHERMGYFERESIQTVSKRLERMPYAQAGVIFDANGTHLISYTTLVCTIDPNGWLSCTGTYSQTTRRHISAFMREFAPHLSYFNAKECYTKGHELNIHTGEVRPL